MTTVVVTGLGAVTPLGNSAPETWAGMLAGRSATVRLTDDWVEPLPSKIAAPVNFDYTSVVEPHVARKMDRSQIFALAAGLEAWNDCGLADTDVDGDRLAVTIGTGIGGLHSFLDQWDIQKDKGARRVSPYAIPMLMANGPAATLGLRIGARAGVHTPVSACASSNEAIAHALDMIRLGRADVVVAGGTEAVIHPFAMAAFANMQALSRNNDDPEHASRPWDEHRDGFVLGEGAAVLVLETEEHARARGARIYARLAGAGISADSHDMVAPDPSGRGQATAMAAALKDADLVPDEIKHVNAHATSTPTGDGTEAHSIRTALGDATDGVIVTGTKSMTGHLLGGAGALESLATIMALHERKVPPTINLESPTPGLDIDIAREVRDLPSGTIAAINNSFGFGGHNVALAFTSA
ncbi:MAG: beta-ketoacyl-[acyl-carrier-protein] synthase family protein [Propionibacteriaceae bacterium]